MNGSLIDYYHSLDIQVFWRCAMKRYEWEDFRIDIEFKNNVITSKTFRYEDEWIDEISFNRMLQRFGVIFSYDLLSFCTIDYFQSLKSLSCVNFKVKNTNISIIPSSGFEGKSIGIWLNNFSELIPNDLVNVKIDAIVNSSNNLNICGSGIALELKNRLNEDYNIISNKLVKETKISKGDAGIVILNKPQFNISKAIIHAFTVEYEEVSRGLDINPTKAIDVYNALYNALKIADEYGIESLAVPQMVSRIGYSIFSEDIYKKMLSAMYLAINDYLYLNDSKIKNIYIHPSDEKSEKFLVNLFQ